MRLYFRVFSFLPFLLIVWQMSSAEEIIRQGRNRFATHKTELNEKISENRRIRIQSVESLRGKLYITSADVDRAHLEYKKLLRTSEKAEALNYAELIQVTFRDTPSGLELLFQTLNPSPWSRTDNSATVEGEISLPPDSHIEIDAKYFDIIIEGPFKTVSNTRSFGRLDVSGITEKVELTTSHGNITVKNIRGVISIETESAGIRAENIRPLGKPAYFSNDNGDIIISWCEGGLDIHSSYGKIRVDKATLSGGRINIEGNYTPIRLTLDNMDSSVISVTNVNEDIDINVSRPLSASVNLQVDADSEIHVEGIFVKPVAVEPRRVKFVTGSGDSQISVKISGIGDITLKGGQ